MKCRESLRLGQVRLSTKSLAQISKNLVYTVKGTIWEGDNEGCLQWSAAAVYPPHAGL